MQYKQFILGSVFLLIVLGIWSYPADVKANDFDNLNPAKELGYCDPSLQQQFIRAPIPKLKDDVILIEPSEPINSGENLRFRWCFTFVANPSLMYADEEQDIEVGDSLEDYELGTLEVVEFVEIWEAIDGDDMNQQLLKVQASKLSCETVGRVLWDNRDFITFGGDGYISCDTLNLHKVVWQLSNGHYDICAERHPCDLSVEVENYIDFVSPSDDFPFWDGPLFVYENLIISGRNSTNINDANTDTIGIDTDVNPESLTDVNGDTHPRPIEGERPDIGETPYEVILETHGRVLSTTISAASVQERAFVEIEQEEENFSFQVNQNQAVSMSIDISDSADEALTDFSPESTTIYIGYNPNTGEFATGSIYNMVADPMCCGRGSQ